MKIFGKYNLLLVTGDRDIDNKFLKNVKFNKIQIKKYFKILYLQKDRQNIQEHFKIIKSFKPDVIYLNSFFDFKFSILLSLLNKFIFNQKLIISPRGELLSEAVQSKVFKKKFYIFFTKIFKIYSNAVFHINSIKEKKNLIHRIGRKTKFKIVPVFYPSLKKTSLKSLNFERSKFKILLYQGLLKIKI